MEWSFLFFLNSALLGVGLAMDAFSVSLANGLSEPQMKRGRMVSIAGVFGGFQALMPMLGWLCVHTIVQYFKAFDRFIPWIALILLGYIGGKMLWEGLRGGEDDEKPAMSFGMLLVQGVATSIDALSVGFTIADYGPIMALTASIIIAAVTFAICMGGLSLGKRFGTQTGRSGLGAGRCDSHRHRRRDLPQRHSLSKARNRSLLQAAGSGFAMQRWG